MEGPTPVSALIHAATMVTAGVFLLIRISFFFEFSEICKIFLIILGSLTAFISAFTAIFLYDIKRIIAYSTCSQLGYMVLACGLSQYTLSLFHLINHAFFKALLFLTAGAIIHSFFNEQDIRLLSNLFFYMPFIYACMLIGNIAIMGLPFLSGFYSKDLIIEYTLLKYDVYLNFNIIIFIILLATISTAIYSMRLFYFLFLRKNVKNK
jgi:NADH-ubiquinone oxidoreductase chain 5